MIRYSIILLGLLFFISACTITGNTVGESVESATPPVTDEKSTVNPDFAQLAGSPCATDSDCEPLICKTGVCILPCESDEDCKSIGNNYVCSSNICKQEVVMNANSCPSGYIWDPNTVSCIVDPNAGSGGQICTPPMGQVAASQCSDCGGGSLLNLLPNGMVECVCDSSLQEIWSQQLNYCIPDPGIQPCSDPFAVYPSCTLCQPGYSYSTTTSNCQLNSLVCQPPTTNVNNVCVCPNGQVPNFNGCECGANQVQTPSGGCACMIAYHMGTSGCVPDCVAPYTQDPQNPNGCILSVSCPTGYQQNPANPNECVPQTAPSAPAVCADGSIPGSEGCPQMASMIVLCNVDSECPSNYRCVDNVCKHTVVIVSQASPLVQPRQTICPFCTGESDGFGNVCLKEKHPGCPSVHTISRKSASGSTFGDSDTGQGVEISQAGIVNELASTVEEIEEVQAKTLVASAGSFLDDILEKILVIDRRRGEHQHFIASESKLGKKTVQK